MNTSDDNEAEKNRRAQEAANILRRLEENPSDSTALEEKRIYLARGEAERRTYALAERAFSAARTGLKAKDRRDKKYGIAVLGAVLASLYLGWEPISVAMRADHRSGLSPEIATLKSGDEITLDASSAIVDGTDADVRSINLLRGAGYFDVETDGRSFVVMAGDVQVEVLGTEFEVSRLGDAVRVSVAEGVVEVRQDDETVTVTAGAQVFVSNGTLTESAIPIEDVARWRDAELTLTGLTLAEAAVEIDRRLSGRIVVMGEGLRNIQVGGSLDLKAPENALETLAAAGNARVIRTSPFLTVIYPR